MIVVRYFFPPRTNTLIEHATMVQLFNDRVKEKDSINVPVNHFACCRERNELCGEHKCSKLLTQSKSLFNKNMLINKNLLISNMLLVASKLLIISKLLIEKKFAH